MYTENLSFGNFNFEIKKEVPMLIEEQWGIENAPFWYFLMFITEDSYPVVVISLWVQTHKNMH